MCSERTQDAIIQHSKELIISYIIKCRQNNDPDKIEEQAVLKCTYGSEGKKLYENYVDNKMKDLYTRMGNTILKEMKEYDKLRQPLSKAPVSKQQKFSERINGHSEISRCLQTIKKSLKKDFESVKNQRYHDRLLQEIEYENE